MPSNNPADKRSFAIVVRPAMLLSSAEAERVQAEFREAFPGVKVVLLPPGCHFEVIHAA